MHKIAVIMYGAPGSGKGTQAKLLAEKKQLIHFDTGRYIEGVVHDPKNVDNKKIQRERQLFDAGVLNTPAWVLDIVKKGVKKIATIGSGVIFSGSPRTMFEVTGDEKTEGLISVLERLYGKENIYVFSLTVKPTESLTRNSRRLVCEVCDLQVMGEEDEKRTTCPFCGGHLGKRTLDDPETIKVRWKEYQARTKPIEAELKKQGYTINKINASPLPYKVFASIVKRIK